MCKCIFAWTQDDSVEGSHDRLPMFCEEYISDLEELIVALDGAVRLESLREAYGVERRKPVEATDG